MLCGGGGLPLCEICGLRSPEALWRGAARLGLLLHKALHVVALGLTLGAWRSKVLKTQVGVLQSFLEQTAKYAQLGHNSLIDVYSYSRVITSLAWTLGCK